MEDLEEIVELRERVAELEKLVAGLRMPPSPPRTGDTNALADKTPMNGPVARRSLLRGAGVAAAAAAAATVVGAKPAAAANGDPLVLGAKNTATAATTLIATNSLNGLLISNDPNDAPALPLGGEHPNQLEVHAFSGYSAIKAVGSAYGADLSGSLAPLRLDVTYVDPRQDNRAHVRGEMVVLTSNQSPDCSLWFCTRSGTPGNWRMVAGPKSNVYNAIDPTRIYDSREGHGPLAGGGSRTVGFGVADTVAAYLINLTIVNTTGAGFLALRANGGPASIASAINWFVPNEIVANTTVTNTDPFGSFIVTAGGGGSTDFVIDVLGYFV